MDSHQMPLYVPDNEPGLLMPEPDVDTAQSQTMIFEVAWEVCAQSGGIYTVLRSKAPAAAHKWGQAYCLVGPYREQAAQVEFEPEPPTGIMAHAVQALSEQGITVHAGRWLTAGRPQVLLIDLASVEHKFNEYKYYFWKDIGIGTPGSDRDVDEVVAFGFAAAELLQAIRRETSTHQITGHFHEWQGAAALPLLKHRKIEIATVFTTHATLVGRSLSANNVNLYDNITWFDGYQVATDYNFKPRFEIERTAAQQADVFTTVSGITAIEAEQFLQRKPDVLVPNGLNVERFAAPHTFQNLHKQNKDLISEFVMGHFFPNYTFDLDQTLYFFTAGRYEYRNKGFDVFIEALYRLNERLKANPAGMTIVAFIIAPANHQSLNIETLNRQAMLNELRENCSDVEKQMGRNLLFSLAQGRLPTTQDLLDESARIKLKRMLHAWKQANLPPIVTHNLSDDANDAILRHLRHRHLTNQPDDPVKVVFHPEFITSTSPILGLEYDEFVRGCNLGVFPSYYEPWGYTPMECVVRGIPAITSDLSGFGAYVMNHFPDHDENGIFVARRAEQSVEQTIEDIASWMYQLTKLSRRDRIQLRNRVERHAEYFDWSQMTRYYRAARELAVSRQNPKDTELSENPSQPQEAEPTATDPRPDRQTRPSPDQANA